MSDRVDQFYGTVCPAYFSCLSSIWPDTLNHPPSAFIPTSITNILQNHPDPQSASGFQANIQNMLNKGFDKIEVVPREILETAKGCLSQAQTLLWQMDNWLYTSAKVLNRTSFLNGIGAALIALGALGTYFMPSDSAENNNNRLYKRISYCSIATGLSLVALSTYRVHSVAQYTKHIATKLPQ